MADIENGIVKATGDWSGSTYESDNGSKWGLMYGATAPMAHRVKELGDELRDILNTKDPAKKLNIDDPLILGKITSLSGNYNMARQLQSNLMKAIKDTASAIIRNV